MEKKMKTLDIDETMVELELVWKDYIQNAFKFTSKIDPDSSLAHASNMIAVIMAQFTASTLDIPDNEIGEDIKVTMITSFSEMIRLGYLIGMEEINLPSKADIDALVKKFKFLESMANTLSGNK